MNSILSLDTKKMIITIIIILGYNCECISQDYYNKIDNRIFVNTEGLSIDSINKIREKNYFIAFNFLNQEIRETYSDCMGWLDEKSLLKNVITSNHFGCKPDKLRIVIGESVPIDLTKQIIKYYNDSQFEFELIYSYNNYHYSKLQNSPKRDFGARIIYIGAAKTNYSKLNRYIISKKAINELVEAKSKLEFKLIFDKYNVYSKHLNNYFKNLKDKPRFKACENLNNIELKLKCSRDSLNQYVKKNSSLNKIWKTRMIKLNLDINSEGYVNNVTVSNFSSPLDKDELIELTKLFKEMPKWKPGMKNGVAVKSKYKVYFKIPAYSN